MERADLIRLSNEACQSVRDQVQWTSSWLPRDNETTPLLETHATLTAQR
jgi:hypothetical protein